MNYLRPKFSHYLSGKAYSDNWEAVFGKKKEKNWECPRCGALNYPRTPGCFSCYAPKPE